MPPPLRVDAALGETFELWARGRGAAPGRAPFSIHAGGRLVFHIPRPPPYFARFTYRHVSGGPVDLEWLPDAIEVSLCYHFDPATVAEAGVTFLRPGGRAIESWPPGRQPEWHAREPARPALHFSPSQGWMNDPNGLCRVDGVAHLFYQFHPNGTEWGPMHWGHAASRDLYRWSHWPVFAEPEQNLDALGATGGAFSGSAFRDRDGALSFYYTERLPAYDLLRDYVEVQKRMVPDPDLLRPISSRVVLGGGPGTGHDLRDPKVWFDDEAALYRMVLGTAVGGDPAVVLYGSLDGDRWDFTSVLYRAPARFREGGARCAECPDFFALDGHWVLVAGFVGYREAETGRRNLLYALVGGFANGVFRPHSDEPQELDFGTDFYAMQSFEDGARRIAFAWLFNWASRKPAGSAYSGEMSLPRVLGVDATRRLTMRPEPGLEALRRARLDVSGRLIAVPDPFSPVEVGIKGDLAGLRVVACSADGHHFTVEERDGRLHVTMPEDKRSAIAYRSQPLCLAALRIVFDRGVLELFANDGAVCGTRRSHRIVTLDHIKVAGAARVERVEAWQYASAWAGPKCSTA